MGCKSNQFEGNLIETDLIKNKFKKADKISDADFFILNSCTVTHKSDNEAFNILHKAKRENPEIITVLTGCIAQVEKEILLKNSDIDIVVGNDEKLTISKHLLSSEKCLVKNIMEINFFNDVLLEDTKKTRASLKIQDGCDNRCSYCIIPFARGKNRSAKADFILNQIKMYEDTDFKEIVMTGIHIGQWGQDFNPQKSLLNLLMEIEEKTEIKRFRLGSLNPLEINDDMLEFLKNSEKFCPHFHLSLQSMCDKTLKSMNRYYRVEEALDLIEKINDEFDLPFIGSDIIAGFADESEEDFLETVENLKKSKLTQIHTFPYSVRKGTEAVKLKNHLDSKAKEQRAKIIKEISAEKHKNFLQKNINTIQEVLIEKNIDKKTGCLKGVTRNYINVLIKPEAGFDALKNTIQRVLIEKVDGFVFASIIDKKNCANNIRKIYSKTFTFGR